MPNTFITQKTLSSYRYVYLFIAFQAIHPSSMADPYSFMPINNLPFLGLLDPLGDSLTLTIDINDNFSFDQQSPPLSLMAIPILFFLLPLSSCCFPYHDALSVPPMLLSPPLTSMAKGMCSDVLMLSPLGRKSLPISV